MGGAMGESDKTPRRSAKKARCAIYTRKSSEEGLEQTFNSLDAQREACAAFILSQKHEGWTVLSTLGNDPLALPAALIENDLVRAGEHTFHSLEIESFARHLGRFLILLIYLVDAGNLTGCLCDGLELVAFRLLDNCRGLAPCL